MKRMQGLDTVFFHAETQTMPLHVIGALVLDPTDARSGWGYDTVLELMRERIHLLAPLRWRAVPVPAGLDQPRWIEDPDFDLARHIHRATLAEPGDLDALADFVAEVAAVPLERDRPLWEMFVVEGMADGSVALVTKLHHAFMDGGAGSEIMSSLFDLDPAGDEIAGPDHPWQPEQAPPPIQLLAETPGGALARLAGVPGLVNSTAKMLVGKLGSLPSAGSRSRDEGRSLVPVGPPTPLNGSLTAERAVAFARCSLEEVRATRAAFGVTVNDVMLAAATSALRDELTERGALPDRPLVGMVPISERASGNAEFSNRTASMTVGLPVQIADPIERLLGVHELAVQAKQRHDSRGQGVLEGWASIIPPWLVHIGANAIITSGVAGAIPPMFNAIISNIPGPPIPLYLAGARVTHLFPMGPLFEGCGVNITLISHDGIIDIGVMACPAMVDDPARLSHGFIAAIDELGELAAHATPTSVGPSD